MSTDTIISVENLSKKYRIRHQNAERYTALRDVVAQQAKRPWQWVAQKFGNTEKLKSRNPHSDVSVSNGPVVPSSRGPVGPSSEDFWALKDVSFEVKRGEVVGIIGRNGAGKSTLLKILSRITEPTTGRVTLRGRVASLLEVGTGFHPELTGRENIFLNGALLGMHRAEIKKKFDEIVAFAEVEKFLDTPVKHFSSGMYVRLAFAVAAHLEPEILIIDEVLAVGDSAFQRKCLARMGEVAKQGRTVLFVSHLMPTIQALCSRAILLEGGCLKREGPTQEIVSAYLSSFASATAISLDERHDRNSDGSFRMTSVEVADADGGPVIKSSSRLKITIQYRSEAAVQRSKFLVGIYDLSNTGIFALDSDASGGLPETLPAVGSVVCITEPICVTAGRCFINLAVVKGGGMADHVQKAAYFDVEFDDLFGTGKVPTRDWVLCLLRYKWSQNGTEPLLQ